MSRKIPPRKAPARGAARAPAADPDAKVPLSTPNMDARLKAVAERHKKDLFEPFVESLLAAPSLQDEIQRIVDSLQVFFNKWTVELILVLSQSRALRFNEMRDQLKGISGRTLSQRLKELEDQGLVARKLYDERPTRIEYSLTTKGMDVAYLALPLVLYLRQVRA